MSAVASRPPAPTYADIEALPDNVVGEIVRGVLHVQPRPAPKHALASSNIGVAVGGPFGLGRGGPGGWIILDEPELRLERSDHPIVPDLAGWRRARMPELPDAAYFSLPPDWICEVISPGTEVLDRGDKMDVYAEAKVGHAWLVDPIAKMLEVYRLDGATWRRMRVWHDDAVVRAEPFDAVELELALLWA
jgi:Uma2 family endonuclease